MSKHISIVRHVVPFKRRVIKIWQSHGGGAIATVCAEYAVDHGQHSKELALGSIALSGSSGVLYLSGTPIAFELHWADIA